MSNTLGEDVCMPAKSCLTLCHPKDCNLPDSTVHGFSRQEHWSGLPCPPPGDLPDPRIKPKSSASPPLQADSLPTELPGKPPGEDVVGCSDYPLKGIGQYSPKYQASTL